MSEPFSVGFWQKDQPLLTFHSDGRVEIGPGMKPDEAGRQAIEAMKVDYAWTIQEAVSAEREACAKIAEEAAAWCRSFGPEGTAEEIAKRIRARKDQP